MLSKLLKKARSGEQKSSGKKQARTDRFVEIDGRWFFRTREGFDVGPFDARSDAEYALLYFVEQAEWPDDAQLTQFIEGCQLIAGASEAN
ncbi:Uncharacterised protein [BD1-7 clade bacterium]|uniref:DUF6316 domain-containing protein n=1 Tax=BD1-7 clade bacterium TaxID=2029982 RepID=A0A5S9QEJ8_9GAMM|nr:Uncharacterised protein [BD1-7 clade bacterium]CAA0116320.1 Uncharacterised protein [BD1-7 clade bacterium]